MLFIALSGRYFLSEASAFPLCYATYHSIITEQHVLVWARLLSYPTNCCQRAMRTTVDFLTNYSLNGVLRTSQCSIEQLSWALLCCSPVTGGTMTKLFTVGLQWIIGGRREGRKERRKDV